MAGKQKRENADAPLESPRARVLNWLKRSLESGEIPAGGEIPSAHAIGGRLGVATNTAAAALDEAAAQGLVFRREGSRRRYAGEVRRGGGDSLASSTIHVLARLDWYDDIKTAPGWSDEFLALDVVRQLSRRGRHVSLINAGSLSKKDFDALFASPPAGLVATSSVNGDETSMRALERCREAGIPAVAYGNAPELRGYDRVYSDHRAGSRDLVRWLAAHGRRRIVPFFPFEPTHFWEQERLEGYAEAMREEGLEPAKPAVFATQQLFGIRTADTPLLRTALATSALLALKRRDGCLPDALLCREDFTAKAALSAIRDLGLVPNRDILVAGYDNMARAPDPADSFPLRPAVTVDKHNERSAEDIAELLLSRIGGTLPPEPQARIHKHEVVELEMTASPASPA